MPAYGSAVVAVYPGDQVVLFNAEGSPGKSVAVNIPPNPAGAAPQFSVNLHFASAPTSFTFNMQGANDDVDGEYVNITSGANTIPTGTATDYQVSISSNAPFLRANLSAQNGGGNVTCKIFRAA